MFYGVTTQQWFHMNMLQSYIVCTLPILLVFYFCTAQSAVQKFSAVPYIVLLNGTVDMGYFFCKTFNTIFYIMHTFFQYYSE